MSTGPQDVNDNKHLRFPNIAGNMPIERKKTMSDTR